MISSKLKLTRYLYNFEEVKLKYCISLFLKKDLNECYFWIYEIYLSDFNEETINIILEIFYEYYALLNPIAERKIIELIKSDEDIELVPAKLTKLLFNLSINYDVFSVIQLIKNIIYDENKNIERNNELISILKKLIDINKKVRITEYLKPFDIKYHKLFNYIYKENYTNICISLSIFIYESIKQTNNFEELNEFYNNLLRFKKNIIKNDLIYYFSSINLNGEIDINEEINISQLQLLIYKIIILVFDIYYSIKNKSSYNKKPLCEIKSDNFSLNTKEIKYIFSLNEEDINFRKEKIYNILKKKRLYFIHQNNYHVIGSFNLLRFTDFTDEDEYITKTLLNWEYYCYNTPIWKKRFNQFNIKVDVERNKIVFENDINDINYENFYEKYGYDLDEQSSLTYDLYYIDKYRYNNWFIFLSECLKVERKDENKSIQNKNKNNIKIKINENINEINGTNYINEYYKYINDNISNINLNNIILGDNDNELNDNIKNNIFDMINSSINNNYNFILFTENMQIEEYL